MDTNDTEIDPQTKKLKRKVVDHLHQKSSASEIESVARLLGVSLNPSNKAKRS